MKVARLVLLGLVLAVLLLQGSATRAQNCTNQAGYYVASLNGNIDPGSADFLSTTVANAKAACAGHLVLILTTNGGDGGSMESMVGSISSYQQWGGIFITLVAPRGAFDFSAGAYISEASSKIFMMP